MKTVFWSSRYFQLGQLGLWIMSILRGKPSIVSALVIKSIAVQSCISILDRRAYNYIVIDVEYTTMRIHHVFSDISTDVTSY